MEEIEEELWQLSSAQNSATVFSQLGGSCRPPQLAYFIILCNLQLYAVYRKAKLAFPVSAKNHQL